MLLSRGLVFIVSMVIVYSFTACASHQDDGYYDRANKASEKALEKLDRE